jgi:hypothetical protein
VFTLRASLHIKHFGLISAICGAERKFESKRTLTRTISSDIDPQALSFFRGRLNVREEENVVCLDLLVFPTLAMSFGSLRKSRAMCSVFAGSPPGIMGGRRLRQ